MASEERGAVTQALGKEGAKAQRQERARCTEGPGEGGKARAREASRGQAAVGDRVTEQHTQPTRMGRAQVLGHKVPRQENKSPPGTSQRDEGWGCGTVKGNGEVAGHLPERDASGQDGAITG